MRIGRHIRRIVASKTPALTRILLVFVLLLAALPAAALNPVKAAQSMARQAAAAFEAGDHVRAAQLYQQAYTSDAATPEYLYGAARAEHVGGKLDLAERDYVAYLATGATTKADNARKYLAELRRQRAEERVSDAEQAARARNWPLAAQLYRDAHELAPERADCLFGEAMARAEAAQRAAAIALFEQYLREAPKEASDRGQARVRLEALRSQTGKAAVAEAAVPAPPMQKLQPSKPVQVPLPLPPAVHKDGDAQPQRANPLGWAIVGAGGVLAATGLGLAIWVWSDRADLDAKVALDPKTGLVEGIDYKTASQRNADIHTRRIWAGALGGLGVATAATGGWLLWQGKPGGARATLVPNFGGASLAVRF